MSAGSYGTDPGQPGPYSQGDWPPPPPQYPQPGTYGYPASPQFQHDYAAVPRHTNSLAIAALCCGVGQCLAGPLASIPAIILGTMSIKQIRETGEEGHGMAVAGLVLGIVGTLLFVLGIVLFIAFVSFAFHQGHQFNTNFPNNNP